MPEPETNPVDLPNVGEIVDERVDAVEQQFQSELQDTRNAFNQQIDSVTGSVSDLESNVQESFSALGSGLESTQQAVSSIPGSIASLLNGQDQNGQNGGEGDGLSTATLAAGAVAVAAVAYSLTQS
jgi:hypothetical protein